MIRCPKCGRASDGKECFACGHVWTDDTTRPIASAAEGMGPGAHGRAVASNPFDARPATGTNPFAVAPSPPPSPPPSSGALDAGTVSARPERESAEVPEGETRQVPLSGNDALLPVVPTRSAGRDGVESAPASGATATPDVPEGPDSSPDTASVAPVDESHGTPERPGEGSTRRRLTGIVFLSTWGLTFALLWGFVPLYGDSYLARIDRGQADEVRREILAIDPATRTPEQALHLGHALAMMRRTDDALRAYHAAAKRGVVDERALHYVVEALHKPLQEYPKQVLQDWPTGQVDDALKEAAVSKPWTHRHHAHEVLVARRVADEEITEQVAILDLLDATRGCDDRQGGLRRLAAIGRSDAALDAIDAVQRELPVPELSCMATDLAATRAAVSARRP